MRENLFDTIYEEYPDAKLLKEGGQKSVFKITHPKYGKSVIKVGDYDLDITLERIEREFAVLKSIDSPYFPKNYELRIDKENRKFKIIEEFIDSTPLADKIGEFGDKKEIFWYIREMAEGLKVLWDQKIVHRDVKPANVLITKEGIIKIIDLGIARLLDAESLTATACLIGPCTAIYASPEQIHNMKLEIDWRSDQFNLGIISGQMLYSGIHPFSPELVSGESIVTNILQGKWHKDCLNELDDQGKRILTKMLGFKRHQRFRTPDILLRELTAFLEVCA